ncbi:glycine oxidase ThiO [Corynebacterium riegelii]|uniref:glycine oxidase ThiO n=1 Tax=Corynebacterium riegelii TaxID=156976 RepID=UPI000C783718|nr:glycine oxidase ThiO [Corynebacterium riegelii]PLA11022.1 glycine oxidase ThiO [Corynebacterium riegelii]
MENMNVAVIGGGIIGLTSALTLAERGHAVTVFDPAPVSGASWHAGGMLAPTAEVVYKQEPLFPLMNAAAKWYPELIQLVNKYSDLPTGYRTDGTLVVARDRADNTHLEELSVYQALHGMEVNRLTTREARKREPALSPALAGAVEIIGDHQVQPRLFAQALLDACANAGVTIVQEAVTNVDDANDLDADQVLIAAGLGAAEITGWFMGANPLELRPVYGDILHVRVPKHQFPLLDHVVRGFVEDRPIYLIPRGDGTLTIGATTREDGRAEPQVQGVYQLLRDAIEVCPALEECDFLEADAGARPGSPDDLPYLGRVNERVTVSTGYFRHGILLAGMAARCGADLVEQKAPAISLEACDPWRHQLA